MIPTTARNLTLSLFLLGLLAFIAGGCSQTTSPQNLSYSDDSTGDDMGDDNPDDNEPQAGTGVGQRAPDFTLNDYTGASHTLSEYRGQPVVLYFWASYCTYCTQQNPRIQAFQDQYAENLTVLTVNLGDTEQVIQAYLTEHTLDFPVLLGNSILQTQYRVYAVPHALVLDAEGLVQFNDHPALLADDLLVQLTTPQE